MKLELHLNGIYECSKNMSKYWDLMKDCGQQIVDRISKDAELIQNPYAKDYPWQDFTWSSKKFRRAHVSIVDETESKKIWLIHCCIFPHVNDPAPIWGFDVVCGKNKVTGAFHDFSPTGDSNHPMINWFSNKTRAVKWAKTRDLPEWAKNIFSPDIVAVSNINLIEELETFIRLGLFTLDYYLDFVGVPETSPVDYTLIQNYYCDNQRANPHAVRSINNLGLDMDRARSFVDDILFPKI